MYWVYEIDTLHAMRKNAIHVVSALVNQFNHELKASVIPVIRDIETELAARAQPFVPYVPKD